MAKKVTVTTTEDRDEGIDAETPEALDDDVIRALTELEGADEITWQIHRISEPNSGFCGEMSTVELTQSNVARAYGPGRYRVKGIRPDGKYFKSGRLTIAMPTNNTQNDDKTAELLESLKGKNGGDAMMPLLLSMIQSNGQIVAAALAKPDTKRDFPWGALVAAAPATLMAMKEFFKNDTDTQSMEKLLKELTILEKLRGTDDKSAGTSWPDIIRDGLSTLRGMAPVPTASVSASMAGRSTQPVSARVAEVAHGSLPVIETPEAIEPTSENLTMDWLRKKIDELLQNASQNKNAELRAEVFIDDLPAFIPETLIREMLTREDWFEQLCAFDQRALNYHGWLNEFRNCVLDTLNPDGETHDRSDERTDSDSGISSGNDRGSQKKTTD